MQVMPDSNGTYTYIQDGARVQGQITSAPHSPAPRDKAEDIRSRTKTSASHDPPHTPAHVGRLAVTKGESESDRDECEQVSRARRSGHDPTPHRVSPRLRSRSRCSLEGLSSDDERGKSAARRHRRPTLGSDPSPDDEPSPSLKPPTLHGWASSPPSPASNSS